MATTIVKPRKKQLRGPRYRQERRHLRRGTWFAWKISGINKKLHDIKPAMEEFQKSMAKLADDAVIWDEANRIKMPDVAVVDVDPSVPVFESVVAPNDPPQIPTITIVGEPYACKTCGATGDDPCMTKSGKVASKEHSGRTVL